MELVLEHSKDLQINIETLVRNYSNQKHDSMTDHETYSLLSNIAMTMSVDHYDYNVLASRINRLAHNMNACTTFVECIKLLRDQDMIHDKVWQAMNAHGDQIESWINPDRDLLIDYFGWKTLQKAYLLSINGRLVETPQFMWMRIALGIWAYDDHCDLERVRETYDLMSQKYFTHATPTLFHCGTKRQQLSSCFLLGTDDSIEGIYKTVTDIALISKWAGGIGIHVSNIRANQSKIKKTNGISSGILPMLRVFNNTARHINQSGKRLGSVAVYLEPWHFDVFDFLSAKKNHGNEEERARDLFYGMWIPDLFMERVESNEMWSLMCPNECKGLTDSYGDDFEALYKSYESNQQYRRQVLAREIWDAIIESQIETGMPYMLYKDACNRKSNQKNIGTIKSSNLCTEIIQYSDDKEYAVCNLASVGLPMFLDDVPIHGDVTIYASDTCAFCHLAQAFLKKKQCRTKIVWLHTDADKELFFHRNRDARQRTLPQIYVEGEYVGGYEDLFRKYKPRFNFERLRDTVGIMIRNLNRIIDINFYPVPETKTSNMKHRPVGIGCQGLADVFGKLQLPFDSAEARALNQQIFEHIYYAAINASCDLAKVEGAYLTFEGSPMSKGIFQFNMWNKEPSDATLDWNSLRARVIEHGIRNSLLVAPMPVASTSQILGFNECFEPYTSNLYTRRTLAGEFIVVNKHLIAMLQDMGKWDEVTKMRLIQDRGSVQKIGSIPQYVRNIFKTSWELKQKVIVDMAIDRGAFICQSQSLNLFCENPSYNLLSKIHLYGWKNGLKTGSYYIRSKPKAVAQNVSVSPTMEKEIERIMEEEAAQDDEGCLYCG